MAINLSYSPTTRGFVQETEAEKRRKQILAKMGRSPTGMATADSTGGRDVGFPYGVQPEGAGVMGRYSTVAEATQAVQQGLKSPMTGEDVAKPRDWQEFGSAEQWENLEVPPEALENIPTGLAQWLQMRDEARSQQAAAAQAEKAVETLGAEPTGAAAAPDVEGILSQAQHTEQYWTRRKRAARAQAAERYKLAEQRLAQQQAQGAPADWINRERWNLRQELQQAQALADVAVDQDREEYEARLAETEAQAALSRFATAAPLAERRAEALAGAQAAVPTAAATPWTLYEQYGRGARMEQEAADLQRAMALKGLSGVGTGGMIMGGGADGGAPLGPVGGDTSGAGGGVVSFPHQYGSYGEYQQAMQNKATKNAAARWAQGETGAATWAEIDEKTKQKLRENAPAAYKEYLK